MAAAAEIAIIVKAHFELNPEPPSSNAWRDSIANATPHVRLQRYAAIASKDRAAFCQSRKLAPAARSLNSPRDGLTARSITIRSASGYGNGRNNMAFATLKTAV